MEDTVKLDGREFQGITQSLTANQDDYLLGHLRLAGAIEVLGDFDKKRNPRKRAEDLLTNIMLWAAPLHSRRHAHRSREEVEPRGRGEQRREVCRDHRRRRKTDDAFGDREVRHRFFSIRGTIIHEFPEIFEPERKGPKFLERDHATSGNLPS